MPTVVDKPNTVELLRRAFAALAELGASLSDAQWATPTCLPGWSVRDALSHMVGTEAMLLGEDPPSVEISHLEYLRNPVAEANEHWVESMRSLSPSEVLARFTTVTGKRLEALDAMTQADFDAPSWTPAGRDETYGRFMRIRHYDCVMHEHDIRAALDLPPRLDADALGFCLDEVETGLGYIVGRRAAMPDGSRVRIDLTGPVATTYLVAVDGRAAMVPELDGPPTVGLEMPAELFLRLTGGRGDGTARVATEVTRSGDPALGEQLVSNLAFTI